MTRSIRGWLLIGLAIAGAAGGAVLTVIVALQYGFFGSTRPPLGATLREIGYHVVIPLAVFAAFFGAGAAIVVGSTARRLREAAREARAAAERGESHQVRSDDLPAEIRPFAEALNALNARLADHARRQETFAADAAHELKTPLAILALELDKLPAADAARLRGEVDALSEMVDQLLLLARSNAPNASDPRQTVDLVALAKRLAAELAPAAIRDNRSIAFEDRGAVPVCGLEEALASAARTLAVNALRATPEGGEVVLIAGPGPRLCVLDQGEGLDPEALKHFKARGVRADRAAGGEAGLGLSIADRIAEAHGGELQTCMPERAGLRLELPPARS
ncbi:two-component sensor histidine kinase [Marinicauda salina]|uniref:histidine kinase n=1 Tax=Marinicauda salina TaxID=2135793 RepID=A0A2U2BUY4_9PROT|nr:HAMP domain-containing sensor histidine kinase [Marinicauda salina]PWE17790.1 two-component sensor histidine kinase [Marinicauda salina]